MLFGTTIPSTLSSLSPQKALLLANWYLECAYKSDDSTIALELCHETEVSLNHAKKVAKNTKNKTAIEAIASTYIDLGTVLKIHNYGNESQVIYKKGLKLG